MIESNYPTQNLNPTKKRQTALTLARNFAKEQIKRLFDIVASSLGLLLLAPVFVYIAWMIKSDSPGPVFYWGPRMGKNRKPFKILKFRTMYEDQSSYSGPRVTAQGDSRITPLGHWLRDTKINELPQLWNVLVGEMSLVGPRPEDVKIAEEWPKEDANEILSVRPGITSPASILYHDEEKLLSGNNLMNDYFKNILPNKMRLDRLYVRYNSFFSDIDIIFWTLAIIIPRIGKTRIPEGYIFAGPFSVLVRRYVRWFTLDLITALLAMTIASVLWRLHAPLDWGISHLAMVGIVFAFLFSSVNALFKVNKVIWSKAHAEDAITLVFSCGFATVMILALDFLQASRKWLPYPPLPVVMVITAGLLAGIGFLTVRYRLRLITAIASRWLSWRRNDVLVGERVIIVGAGEGAQIANWLFRRNMFRTAFSVVGLVDHKDPTTYGMKIGGMWILGGINDVPALLEKYDVGVILCTLPQNAPEVEFLFAVSKVSPIRVIFLNDLMWIVDQQITKPIGQDDFPIWLEERIDFKIMHDTLTELPSQTLFQDRLQRSLAMSKREKTQRAILFVDLKGLDQLPDDLSRNYLLKNAAQRLNNAKREVDTLTRYNGEMFALLLENVSDGVQKGQIIKRVSDVLAAPFEIQGKQIQMEPLIYISLCTGSCGAAEKPQKANIRGCYECVRAKQLITKSEVPA